MSVTKKERKKQIRQAQREADRSSPRQDKLLVEFQSDAVELEHRKVPGGARWTLYIAMGLIVSFVGWSYWAQVDRIVVANGKLIPTVTPVVVNASVTLPIQEINFRFGERVSAGDVLATLEPTFSEVDVQQLKSKIDAFLSEIARAEVELAGTDFELGEHAGDPNWNRQKTFFVERKREYEAKLNEFVADRKQLVIQQKNTENERGVKAKEAKLINDLSRNFEFLHGEGSAALVEMLKYQLQAANAESAVVTADNRKLEIGAQIEKVDTSRDAYIATWRSELATGLLQSHQQLTEATQELVKAQKMNEDVVLRVPTDSGFDEFVVFEVAPLSVGSVIKAGEPMFRLMPIGAPLEIEVEVSGRDIAKIRAHQNLPSPFDMPEGYEFVEGSQVRVKLNAYNYQKHGFLEGVVRTISEGAFEQKNQQTGATSANYKARIQLIRPIELKDVPSDFRLLPGMSVTAEIKVGKRRVLDYFLYPLLRYLDNSLREP